MTPNSFIIKQQAETMNKFLGHCYEVIKIFLKNKIS